MHCSARLSLDGLVSAMLLLEARQVQDVGLANPKDVLDGLAKVDGNDVLVSLPYHAAAGQWHDHHVSEAIRLAEARAIGYNLRGECLPDVPSTARILWEQLGGGERFPWAFAQWVDAADALEQAGLTPEMVQAPSEHLLLGFLLEVEADSPFPCTQPLATRFFDLVQLCRRMPAPAVLDSPACHAARLRLAAGQHEYDAMVRSRSSVQQGVLLTDLRGLDFQPPGIQAQDFLNFPEAHAQVRLSSDPGGENVRLVVRHSPFVPRSGPAIGALMAPLGGYGHHGAGVCELFVPLLEQALAGVLAALRNAAN
ncbi:hypothetical protein [Megalodesulfovibrio paquesii]